MWYDDIYMLQEGRNWIKINQKLPQVSAYGISVTYKESIVIIRGGDKDRHFNSVISYTWKEDGIELVKYPSLPCPLAFMAGTLVNNLIVVAGGIEYIPVAPTFENVLGLIWKIYRMAGLI